MDISNWIITIYGAPGPFSYVLYLKTFGTIFAGDNAGAGPGQDLELAFYYGYVKAFKLDKGGDYYVQPAEPEDFSEYFLFDICWNIEGRFILIELDQGVGLGYRISWETQYRFFYVFHVITFFNSYSRISVAPIFFSSGINFKISIFLTATFTA